MSRGATMDAISLDEWEFLPDNKTSFFTEECTDGHGTVGGKDHLLFGANLIMIDTDHFTPASHPSPYDCILDQETKKAVVPIQPLEDSYVDDPVTELKHIGVVHAEPKQEEFIPKVTDIMVSDAEEEEEMIRYFACAKEVDEDEVMVQVAPDDCVEEEISVKKDRTGLECNGFSVGKLRVNGVGALCSFGVAAATFCIFLLGGVQQQKKQKQKVKFQMYADDEGIQQVVQQASRLNQAVSSVMGGASTRASISFGGYYDGF